MTEPDYTSPELIDKTRREIMEFFRTFPFSNLLGMEILEMDPGRSRLAITFRPDLCQPAGIMHGGVLASLVDTAIAHAILLTPQSLAVRAHGGGLVSVDLRLKYLRPVSEGRVYCTARVTRPGRTIVHTDAVVVDEAGKEVVYGDSIYMIITRDQLKKRSG